ncbi:unnamed protein product [Caenorhabditis auriculariae]|uniref:Carbonic anhydrase n=1 Tax=Caenorhabditis auriculariae TaxID=2777116 RepID=A0A8S1GRE1_9PELO|nr:unnamed protein product [Caenorhabditis auriculariae]
MTGHWSYYEDDGCGPTQWPNGLRQSPVNIDLSNVVFHETNDGIKFVNYDHVLRGELVNNGHSVQLKPELYGEAPEIYGGGLDQVYRLVQYHFHWGSNCCEGSEHLIDGKSYPAELHLVHQGTEDPNMLAVIGVFLEIGDDGSALAQEEQVLSRLQYNNSSAYVENIVLADKLPINRNSFFRYSGSLTTPPCSEVVTWTVFPQPIQVTEEQLDLFRNVEDPYRRPIVRNFRPVQELYDREITQYEIV